MQRKRLRWQIYNSYLLIVILSILIIMWHASRALRQFYSQITIDGLKTMALLVARQLPDNPVDAQQIDFFSKWLAEKTTIRVSVILPSGKVIGDTAKKDLRKISNQSHSLEFKEAMDGRTVTVTRRSHTMRKNMIYVATPLLEGDKIIGVVRVSIMEAYIDKNLRKIYLEIIIGGLAIAVLSAVISFVFSRKISRPLEEMKLGAEGFARGELENRLSVPDSEEIGGLAEAMNLMAAQLNDRIRTIMEQRNLQEAVLSSMVEGVLAVDTRYRIIILNQAASELIGTSKPWSVNDRAQDVIDNDNLHYFIRQTLSSKTPIEDDIILDDKKARFLQAHGTILSDVHGNSMGALVVLNDVTRIRMLEDIQRSFVANVSHELKTPVTSIQGFAETLLEGAVGSEKDIKHFLSIIGKQANRLNVIIEDLLLFSRIEQESEKNRMVLQEKRLKNVLESAVQICEMRAEKKNICIDLVCKHDLTLKINPVLLEQAVVNFIVNAIKYSDIGGVVYVVSYKSYSKAVIEVRDNGCGIARDHIPLLFERFYRVDKARSRKAGGTGLGLAIVKRIVHAHGGHLTVDSTPGKGSIFAMHIPVT